MDFRTVCQKIIASNQASDEKHLARFILKLVDDMKAGLGEDATAVDMIAEMEEKLKKTWEETESMSVQTLSGFSFSR